MTTERIAEQTTFAYWVPNVSGGLVTSDIEQRTDWNFEYNKKLARTAENNGFEYALSQVRYEASYGAEFQHESTSFSLALLLATERLKVIAAVHPGLWQPGVLAKLLATADQLSGGRAAVMGVHYGGDLTCRPCSAVVSCSPIGRCRCAPCVHADIGRSLAGSKATR